MELLITVLFIVALAVAVIELVREQFQDLLAWSVVLACAGLVLWRIA